MAMKFDELNTLKGNRSMPYDKYFGEMELTDEQIEDRIKTAEEIGDLMIFLFALIITMLESDSLDRDYIVLTATEGYMGIIRAYMGIDKYLDDYIREFSTTFLSTTLDNINDAWYFSRDRAMFIAENESNNVFSHNEYEQAVKEGKTKKEWITMRDARVRHTHAVVDGRIIGMTEQFVVGDSLMDFPRDTAYSPSAKEVIACRCSIKYY